MCDASAAATGGGHVSNLAPSPFSPVVASRGANFGGGGGGGGKAALARGIAGCDDDLGGRGATGFFPGLGEGLGTGNGVPTLFKLLNLEILHLICSGGMQLLEVSRV